MLVLVVRMMVVVPEPLPVRFVAVGVVLVCMPVVIFCHSMTLSVHDAGARLGVRQEALAHLGEVVLGIKDLMVVVELEHNVQKEVAQDEEAKAQRRDIRGVRAQVVVRLFDEGC